MILLVASALAGTTTFGFGTGLDARLGKGAVFIGYGAGPTVRHTVDDTWDIHGEARLLVLAGQLDEARKAMSLDISDAQTKANLAKTIILELQKRVAEKS